MGAGTRADMWGRGCKIARHRHPSRSGARMPSCFGPRLFGAPNVFVFVRDRLSGLCRACGRARFRRLTLITGTYGLRTASTARRDASDLHDGRGGHVARDALAPLRAQMSRGAWPSSATMLPRMCCAAGQHQAAQRMQAPGNADHGGPSTRARLADASRASLSRRNATPPRSSSKVGDASRVLAPIGSASRPRQAPHPTRVTARGTAVGRPHRHTRS